MNKLQIIEYKNQRILTTQQLAEGYGTNADVISKNFNRNSTKYKEGKHYYCLIGEDLKQFKTNGQIDGSLKRINKLYLWTERGTFLHAKSLNTDKAWEVYDELVETYFKAKENLFSLPQTLPEALRLAADLAEKNAALQLENVQKNQIIGELKPKADYTDIILQSKSLVNINQIAKDYGFSARSFNKLLNKMGVQYKQGGQWLLYSQYQRNGYTHSETIKIEHSDGRPDVKMNTKWTQKGRLFIYNLLKGNSVLPVIEQQEIA